MIRTRFQKITLGIAGATALGIGGAILFAPQGFYAGYGIAIGSDPSLLSELRAPGAGLAAFGAVMLAGIFRPALRQPAMVAALAVFLAFPAGRLVGLVADGMPSNGILAALLLELVIAALCVLAWRPGAGAATRRAPG
ncbi:MAG: DUF4345 domain-containing protein [Rhodobacteraceae bacterium]|jgi:hypothetical protein|nr:DUF4345 domain-containing protein [Paracoccaceae bacterium]MBL4557461.1 DUF4345 domain-containing protein [Paracoccaceae bacterium]HBG99869.1 DUF4345 domain-containing protein [Paracoccaceae bacterium]